MLTVAVGPIGITDNVVHRKVIYGVKRVFDLLQGAQNEQLGASNEQLKVQLLSAGITGSRPDECAE